MLLQGGKSGFGILQILKSKKDYLGLFGIIRDYLGLFGIIRDYLGLFGIIWDYLRLFGIIRDYLGLFGIIRDYLGLFGIFRIFSDLKSQKIRFFPLAYDSMSNSFIGFDTPLAHGQPLPDQHRTDSYVELQKWFEEKQTSSFINVHMLQPLLNTSSGQIPSPFLLSAYGIAGTYTAEDVLNRWLWIYEETKKKCIRIIGFSTDCDSRYLRSMRIASGFFAFDIDHPFRYHTDAFKVNIPSHWHWFYLQSSQLCLFIQVSA
ncbi:unnamed protein product [Rotaria sp. Silwood2]|nr:unnamed protein product [Rotaria sp. Silwood2]CAF3861456.1 unnamed protein product [Rotaria sp. Silwood2]CAF3898263.1 unnamed protein product [Rotaria sp. Silwood2]CAF4205188.1 unnamed protein product [Rotaria sp. Silwood2]